MHGATHMLTGVLAGLSVGVATGADAPGLAACAAIGGLAGLAPDWLQINLPGASEQLKGTWVHRGFSHWLWTPLILSYLAQMFYKPPSSLVAAFLAGWVSHILLDALAGGVPAVWPFGRWTWGHVKTGGQIDRLTGGAALVLSGLLLLSRVL